MLRQYHDLLMCLSLFLVFAITNNMLLCTYVSVG